MKAVVVVGGNAIVLELKDSICISCRHCDLETWEKKHWNDKAWTCPEACKTSGVCTRDKIACSLYEPRRG
jgi:hypothetical protein